MNNNNNIMLVKDIFNNLKDVAVNRMCEESIDFAQSTYCGDFHDDIFDYVNGRVSIYYDDQFEYYNNHTEECENALFEFGYDLNDLAKEKTLFQMCCFAGMIGEFASLKNKISSDLDEVKRCLMIEIVIDFYLNKFNDMESITTFVQAFENEIECFDSYDDVCDFIHSYFESQE